MCAADLICRRHEVKMGKIAFKDGGGKSINLKG
jgi:hypothetical protein